MRLYRSMRARSRLLIAVAIVGGRRARQHDPCIILSDETRHIRQFRHAKRQSRHHVLEQFVGQGELVVPRTARQRKEPDIERGGGADQFGHRHRRHEVHPLRNATPFGPLPQSFKIRRRARPTDRQVELGPPARNAVDGRFQATAGYDHPVIEHADAIAGGAERHFLEARRIADDKARPGPTVKRVKPFGDPRRHGRDNERIANECAFQRPHHRPMEKAPFRLIGVFLDRRIRACRNRRRRPARARGGRRSARSTSRSPPRHAP